MGCGGLPCHPLLVGWWSQAGAWWTRLSPTAGGVVESGRGVVDSPVTHCWWGGGVRQGRGGLACHPLLVGWWSQARAWWTPLSPTAGGVVESGRGVVDSPVTHCWWCGGVRQGRGGA